MKRLAPPGGVTPPATAALPGGDPIDLVPLAEEAASRYFDDFPDDLDRYGPEARDWHLHDTRYILAWAIGDLAGHAMLGRQVGWLANVLAARDFPLDRLARNLEIAAAVLGERLPDQRSAIDALFAPLAESVRPAGGA